MVHLVNIPKKVYIQMSPAKFQTTMLTGYEKNLGVCTEIWECRTDGLLLISIPGCMTLLNKTPTTIVLLDNH